MLLIFSCFSLRMYDREKRKKKFRMYLLLISQKFKNSNISFVILFKHINFHLLIHAYLIHFVNKFHELLVVWIYYFDDYFIFEGKYDSINNLKIIFLHNEIKIIYMKVKCALMKIIIRTKMRLTVPVVV